jgi:hypothetical protein
LRFAILALSALVLSACRSPDRAADQPDSGNGFSHPSLPVIATGTGYESPDSIQAGWYRVRFSQALAGRGQNLVLFEINDTMDAAGFAAALDTMPGTPAGAVARGGVESPAPGDTMSFVVHLPAGRYVWTSLNRGVNGRRHVANGVRRELRVTPAPDSSAGPAPTVGLRLVNFAFVGDDIWPAGQHRIRVANEGTQDHMFYFVRLRGDHTFTDWLNDEKNVTSDRAGGVTRLGPGQALQLELALVPGRYVASCLLRDPVTGTSHGELGMLRLITVTEAAK